MAWYICTLLWDGVSRERIMSISPRSRSHLEFKGKMLVRAITLSFIVRFWNHSAHLFTIVGRCVARKNYIDISKVKVTLWVQRSNMAINELVWAITMSFIVRFFKSFGTFVHHRWTVCRAKELRRYLKGQGHTLNLKVENGHKWACPGHNHVVHWEI